MREGIMNQIQPTHIRADTVLLVVDKESFNCWMVVRPESAQLISNTLSVTIGLRSGSDDYKMGVPITADIALDKKIYYELNLDQLKDYINNSYPNMSPPMNREIIDFALNNMGFSRYYDKHSHYRNINSDTPVNWDAYAPEQKLQCAAISGCNECAKYKLAGFMTCQRCGSKT